MLGFHQGVSAKIELISPPDGHLRHSKFGGLREDKERLYGRFKSRSKRLLYNLSVTVIKSAHTDSDRSRVVEGL